jgi:hypothetical protein
LVSCSDGIIIPAVVWNRTSSFAVMAGTEVARPRGSGGCTFGLFPLTADRKLPS